MEDFEFLKNVTIGQYIPTESIVHRLDPRAKLLAVFFLGLAVTATRSLVGALLLVLLLMAITRLAQLPIVYLLRGLLPGLPFLILLFAMQFLFQGRVVPCDTVYYEWWFFRFTPCLMRLIALGALRVIAFLFLVSLLTLSTTSSHLTHAIEILLSPLQRIGLPTHEIALANMIALRFIPTLAEELERIAKAQASRGGGMGKQPWWRPDQMARARLPLLVPLFVNALRRAEELVLAMEARCYLGGKGRTKFVQFKSRPLDWVVVALSVLIYLVAWRFPWASLTAMWSG